MNPVSITIENFMCYENAHIDFNKFSSALIVGRVDGNDLYSNNVGKTTIYKAIEYVLFNKATCNLELLIRDNTDSCKVTFEFITDDVRYKIVRVRTKKGVNDLKLLKFKDASEAWEDISCRRVADTEDTLANLIKISYYSFRNTVHFIQNDFSGLATSTPEKRKSLLKEVLQLTIYSKLEKLAKDKQASIQKQIDGLLTLIKSVGEPEKDLLLLTNNLSLAQSNITSKEDSLSNLKSSSIALNDELNSLERDLSTKEKDIATLLLDKDRVKKELEAAEKKKANLSSKKDEILASSKKMVAAISSLKEELTLLQSKELQSELDKNNSELLSVNDSISKTTALHNMLNEKLTEAKKPLPSDNFCKHCKQKLTEEHRQACEEESKKEIELLANKIAELNCQKKQFHATKELLEKNIKSLSQDISKLNSLSSQIQNQVSLVENNKPLFTEYKQLLEKECSTISELTLKYDDIVSKISQLDVSSFEKLKSIISNKKISYSSLLKSIDCEQKELSKLLADKAVIEHNISSKKDDIVKLEKLLNDKAKLVTEVSYYPDVIEGFGSSGITNLIIQNVLDDLQIESNNLLSLLKPGVQLSFVIEKTKSNGSQDDTLDILYYVNGKQRDFEQISGATKIAVQFSLKLGLFSILQKIFGVDLRLLLLDEVDQPLDKAGIDALSDIIKFFQKDFKILVITHNDRLKDKFQHFVIVEQDKNMVSKIIQQSS